MTRRPATHHRTATRALAAVTFAVLASACRSGGLVEDDQRQLGQGVRLVDSLRTAADPGDAGAVTLGYLERLRLGVAAPFQLVEQASVDPRLPVSWRDRVGWALIDRMRRGEVFESDTTALGDGPDAPPTVIVDGGWHRAFIDSLVRVAPSARTGEETVRLTYALARAEWLVTPRTAAAAVDAAALARDRRLTASDVARLLAAPLTVADSTRLLLARSWRIARLFASERPLLADDLAPDHARAVQDAERALEFMRVAALRAGAPPSAAGLVADSAAGASDAAAVVAVRDSTAPRPTTEHVAAPPDAERPAFTPPDFPLAAAGRLSMLPSVRTGFPSAQLIVPLGGFHTPDAAPDDESSASGDQLRARLLARARTDEALAAEWALTRAALHATDPVRRPLARAVAAAAVSARTQAQDAPAFATVATAVEGTNAQAALKWRDGVANISADPALPPAWAPHIAGVVSAATSDLRSVLPELALDGLSIRIGDSPKHDLALALHDPTHRTVFLPPLTAAGTLAHEFAHDLDWQTARGRLGVRGVYATDRATRPDLTPQKLAVTRGSARETARVRTFADAVRAMAGVHTTLPPGALGAALGAPPPGRLNPEDNRPAELFARGVDFYVAAALAREGRSDGMLTAVQDALLVGYAGVRAPDPGDGTAEALVDVLGGMTLVPPSARQWYLARFGREGTRTPLAIVGDVLRALPSWRDEGTLYASGVPGGLSTMEGTLSPVGGGRGGSALCRTGPGGGAAAPWQGRLLWLAADARARGYVRARALRALSAGGAWWGWTAQPLLGGPWRAELAESSVGRLRDAVLRAAATDRDRRLPFVNAGGGCPW